ncbi:hypothetical protein GOODEAATRI_001833, partial [Goodea atripinnis]
LMRDNGWDLTHLFLISASQQYNKDLAKVFEGVQVDLKDISLLDRASRDNLMNFANSGVGEIDYPAYLAEVNKGVTVVDLLSFCSDLEDQADQLPRGALENALKGHASSIRAIHREQVVPLEQAMVKVTNILTAIDAAEYLITHNASHVVKQLTAEVAQCKPISNMVDSMEIVACSFIIDSVLHGVFLLSFPSSPRSILCCSRAETGNRDEQVCDISGNVAPLSSPYNDTLTWFPRASAPPGEW